MDDLLAVPSARARALRPILERLAAARSVVLTTHVNADGDGCGSQAALAAALEARGTRATIVNPTSFPETFRFVLPRPGLVAEMDSPAAEAAFGRADLFVVLDTAEPKRVGQLARALPRNRTVVIDHHPDDEEAVGEVTIRDPSASATGELIHDAMVVGREPITPEAALGIYVALVSDTGSFRFSNTTPRVLAIAARMLTVGGIDVEGVYRRLYATAPRRRLDLLREGLETLQVGAGGRVAWVTISKDAVDRLGVQADDFDVLLDQVRSLEGVEVAMTFRETVKNDTKISFRSNGAFDVNRVARMFDGGGHVKAAGAVVQGPPEEVSRRVVDEIVRIMREG